VKHFLGAIKERGLGANKNVRSHDEKFVKVIKLLSK